MEMCIRDRCSIVHLHQGNISNEPKIDVMIKSRIIGWLNHIKSTSEVKAMQKILDSISLR